MIEILKWSAKTDPLAGAVLEASVGNATYLSHQIQNELLNIMANQIRLGMYRDRAPRSRFGLGLSRLGLGLLVETPDLGQYRA